MDVATTTLGGFVSLLGMSFVNDMHIMECEQFLFFISISLSAFQKATDHFQIKIRFWTGVVFKILVNFEPSQHLRLTYGNFTKFTQNALESSAKILIFWKCPPDVIVKYKRIMICVLKMFQQKSIMLTSHCVILLHYLVPS